MAEGNYKSNYNIDVYYKPEESSIFGRERVLYKNTEDRELKEVYFHLYANYFKKKSTVPMLGDIYNNYPEGFNPGQIDIINVKVNEREAIWKTEGEEETILSVKLSTPLKVGNKIQIDIDFQEKLPISRTDFGSFNKIACFENWYPVLCVFDKDGWHKERVCKMGESNFSEISDYTIAIDLPENEVVASSGKIVDERKFSSGRKSITIKADNVRDFTWISSSELKTAEKKSGKVLIKSYFLEEDKGRGVAAIGYAERALKFFSEVFGQYPYDSFNIVETYLYGGAMEYPLLTSISRDYYKSFDEKALEGAVVHETAHQWWYVTVGNNEYREPWLDEALATYSEAMYFERYYGKEAMSRTLSPSWSLEKLDKSPGDRLDRFENATEYSIIVYLKGANILDQFRNRVSDIKFYETIQKYYSLYKFKNASISDFLDIVKSVCGSSASDYIKLKLSGIE